MSKSDPGSCSSMCSTPTHLFRLRRPSPRASPSRGRGGRRPRRPAAAVSCPTSRRRRRRRKSQSRRTPSRTSSRARLPPPPRWSGSRWFASGRRWREGSVLGDTAQPSAFVFICIHSYCCQVVRTIAKDCFVCPKRTDMMCPWLSR